MSITAVLLATTVDVHITDQAGIHMSLPDRVGSWFGQEIRYCHNRICLKEFRANDTLKDNVCPSCSSELFTISYSEKQLLPNDTSLLRKRYVHDSGKVLYASIVLSGKERTSIHRPQICLQGQGRQIMSSSIVPVELVGRDPLQIKVLDLLYKTKNANNQEVRYPSYYAYWFVGKNRETPYHLLRMFWMGMDRIFRNIAHRWAYISISGQRDINSEEYINEVSHFVSVLYPQIISE